jgi:hypothetical protein
MHSSLIAGLEDEPPPLEVSLGISGISPKSVFTLGFGFHPLLSKSTIG